MKEKFEKRLKRNIPLDYIGCFITNLNMQSSIWVLYLAYCGMNLAQIGILEGFFHITSMIFEVPSGAVADLLGRKKSIILSKLCIVISCIIMLFSRNFWLFALSFFIQALGYNFNSGSEEALVYDSMKAVGDEERYIGVNGKLNMIIEISQGIATVAGGVLAEYSFFWCYLASTIIAALAFVPLLFMTEAPFEKPETEKNVLKKFGEHFKSTFGILRSDIRIFRIVVFYAMVFAVGTLMFFYSQEYFYDLGFNKIYISVFMLIYSIFCCLGAFLSEKVYDRFGGKVATIASLLTGLCIAGYVFNNAVLSVVLLTLSGFCASLLYPIQSGELNKLIPSEQRATLISVNSMFFSIAMILLFPIAGFFADSIGLGKVFVAIGGLLILFTLVWKKE